MARVTISKMCGCVKKEEIPQVQEFPSVDEALKVAKEMTAKMNDEFCGKHNFSVVQNGGEITIQVVENKR